MSKSRRWQACILVSLVLVLLLSLSVSAAENPQAAVRMQNGDAVLYNPSDNPVYTNLSGFQEVPRGSGFYYFFRNTSGVVYNSGKFAAGGKIYFAHENGQLHVGLLISGRKAWYFLRDASMVRQTIVKSADRVFYYAGKNGKLKTGLKKINGAYYYFDPDDYQMQFGWVESGGDTLYGMLCDVGTLWVFAVPVAFLAANVWHLPFVWVYMLAYLTEDLPKVVICLQRFFSKKWLKPVTPEGIAGLAQWRRQHEKHKIQEGT